MSKFTPGPWDDITKVKRPYKICDVGGFASVGFGEPSGGACYFPTLGVAGISFEQVIANTNLIAAAPDLYAALEDLLAAYKQVNESECGDENTDRAEEALRKARGEA